jgi:hypothetical protein
MSIKYVVFIECTRNTSSCMRFEFLQAVNVKTVVFLGEDIVAFVFRVEERRSRQRVSPKYPYRAAK